MDTAWMRTAVLAGQTSRISSATLVLGRGQKACTVTDSAQCNGSLAPDSGGRPASDTGQYDHRTDDRRDQRHEPAGRVETERGSDIAPKPAAPMPLARIAFGVSARTQPA